MSFPTPDPRAIGRRHAAEQDGPEPAAAFLADPDPALTELVDAARWTVGKYQGNGMGRLRAALEPFEG